MASQRERVTRRTSQAVLQLSRNQERHAQWARILQERLAALRREESASSMKEIEQVMRELAAQQKAVRGLSADIEAMSTPNAWGDFFEIQE